MPHRVIDTPEKLDSFIRLLGTLKLPLTVEWVQGRDRTGEQNRLQWLWAKEVAEQLGDRDAADVQADWKLRHGIPILREDSPSFRETYDRILKPLTYEAKLNAIKFLDLEVTRAMRVRQMVRYLDAVERECRENGIEITEPDPDLAKYQSRYRAKKEAA